jgi:SET family sugar efflux transporter-like MFS transporter
MPLMRWCTVATALGWMTMSFVTHLWMAVIISIVAFGIGSASVAILFAAIRDEMSHRPTGLDNRLMTTIRLAYTGGWIIGPVFGGWFSDQFDLRLLFFVAGITHLISIVPVLSLNPPRFVSIVTLPTSIGHTIRHSNILPLVLFAMLCTIALSGNNVKFSFLPIYASDDLAIPASVIGAIIAIQPVFEVITMVFCGILADRYGPMPVITSSVLLGVSSYLIFATSQSATGLFAAQIVGAALNAAVIGLGIVVAQEIYPQGIGLASSVFYSSIGVSSTLGGLVGAAGVASFGLPGVFYVPGVLCLLVFAGMIAIRPLLHPPA